jgi:arabinogalactan oligomer/maltooligosaccharide transport system substrate-binding protein
MLALLCLLLCPGCARHKKRTGISPDGKVILTFWHTMNREETETLLEMIGRFEKENPGVRVDLQPVPFDEAQNKFKITAMAGDAPDVFRSEIAWTCEEAALGYLLELDGYISRQDMEDYMDAPMKYNFYKGRCYGIPQVTDCLALLYNRRILKEAGVSVPRTMDEFRDACRKLTIDTAGRDSTREGFQKGSIARYGFYFTGKAYDFQPFMWAFGGGLLDPEKREILINSQGTVDAINFLIGLRDGDGTIPVIDLKSAYDNMMAGFKAGRYAMIFNGPWAVSDILSGEEFKDPENLGVAVIPSGPGGHGSPAGGHNYVISRGCPHPDEAYRLIEFLNRPQNQAALAVRNKLLPTRKSAYGLPGVAENAVIQGFRLQLEQARNRPVVPQGGLIYNEFNPYLQAAYLKAMPPGKAMDEVARNWKKMMGW